MCPSDLVMKRKGVLCWGRETTEQALSMLSCLLISRPQPFPQGSSSEFFADVRNCYNTLSERVANFDPFSSTGHQTRI